MLKNRRFTQGEGCGTEIVIYYGSCFVLSLLGLFPSFFLSFLLGILLDGPGFFVVVWFGWKIRVRFDGIGILYDPIYDVFEWMEVFLFSL